MSRSPDREYYQYRPGFYLKGLKHVSLRRVDIRDDTGGIPGLGTGSGTLILVQWFLGQPSRSHLGSIFNCCETGQMPPRRSFGRRNRKSRFRKLKIKFNHTSSPEMAKSRRFRKKSASRGPAVSPTHPGLYLQMLSRRSVGRRNRISRF